MFHLSVYSSDTVVYSVQTVNGRHVILHVIYSHKISRLNSDGSPSSHIQTRADIKKSTSLRTTV